MIDCFQILLSISTCGTALGRAAEPPEEEEVMEMAAYAGVDLAAEPHLREVVEGMAGPRVPGTPCTPLIHPSVHP